MERGADSKHADDSDEKSCKGEKDSPDEKLCSPRSLVAKFLEFAADNRDVREAIERFMERNCYGFASAEEAFETGAGHPLEWTRIHEDYLALVEQQLERFCTREDVTSQEVFAATRDAVPPHAIVDPLADPAAFRVHCHKTARVRMARVLRRAWYRYPSKMGLIVYFNSLYMLK